MEVLLCSEKFVKDVTSVSDNLAGKYLLPSIREAQETGLRGILGDCLLERCKQLVADGSITTDDYKDYRNLVDRCQYFLAYTALVEVCNKISFKLTNFGVAKSSDQNLQNADQQDIARQMYYYQAKADSYCWKLQQWLVDNRTLFPELNDCDCSRMRSNLRSAATCGIWLGGARAYKMGGPCE